MGHLSLFEMILGRQIAQIHQELGCHARRKDRVLEDFTVVIDGRKLSV